MHEIRVILIGGTSNVGKSALADSMAARLGWRCISTDSLARHPGRPWKTEKRPYVPEDVAEHYLRLSVDELITDVLRHYERLWPLIRALVETAATYPPAGPLIIEGSALWPERVTTLDVDGVAAFWLTGDKKLLKTRIHEASRFNERSDDEKALVEKFLERTDRYNCLMMDGINSLRLASIDVSAAPSIDELTEECLRLVGEQESSERSSRSLRLPDTGASSR